MLWNICIFSEQIVDNQDFIVAVF